MSYATVQGLIARYGEAEIFQLTDRLGLGVIDDAVALRALNDADATIDTYLGARYSLPLATPSVAVEAAAAAIARYLLYVGTPPEGVAAQYKQSMDWLRDIAGGDAALPEAAVSGEPGGIAVEFPALTFTADVLDRLT